MKKSQVRSSARTVLMRNHHAGYAMAAALGVGLLVLNIFAREATQDPAFEIQNKGQDIWISVTNGDNIVIPKAKVPGKGWVTVARTEARINPNKETHLFVWLKDPGKVEIKPGILNLFGAPVAKPQPDFAYSFAKGKTIYLTWDKRNYARPQTGPQKGTLGKTESGYSTANNVTMTDIEAAK